MKRRNNYLKELQRRREAAASPQSTPSTEKPLEQMSDEVLEELPSDPTIRSELLADELRDVRQELERERKARQQAERRIEAQAQPSSLRDLLRAKQVHKRRTWR
jgi:hypothetical protein